MLTCHRRFVWNIFNSTIVLLVSLPTLRAQENASGQIVNSLLANLKSTSAIDIEKSAATTDALLNRLRAELSNQAIGVVLTQELELDRLASELKNGQPNASALKSIERSLRRILPGRIQHNVNELRTNVAALARKVDSTPTHLEEVRQAIAVIKEHLFDPNLGQSSRGDSVLRSAFGTVAEFHPSIADVETLRQKLSYANFSSLVKKDFLTTVSQQNFTLPVHFRECKDNTSITGDGQVQVSLSLELPLSLGESFLLLHASGTGQINASADRNQAHVRACILPRVHGTQPFHIRPNEITTDPPSISAHLQSVLTNLQLEGLLGNCKLIEKVASRAVQKRLSDNDRKLSLQIEQTAQERIEEEGYELAYRINGLIRHGLWERVESLDFTPQIRLANASEGVRSDLDYARMSQLGALGPRPEIPSDIDNGLDLINWVHESAANNVLDSLTARRLDEATIRGIWEVELKLTSDDWEKMQPPKIPAAITLATHSPVALKFMDQSLELELRVTACEVDGQVEHGGTHVIRIGYLIEDNPQGIHFVRKQIELPESITDEAEVTWFKALERFFAKSMRPLPKFRNSGFAPFLRIGYLSINQGWIVVGASRVSSAASSTTHNLEGVLR